VRLLGRVVVECGGQPVEQLHCGKAQELLAFLLVHRERSHLRETVAAKLWDNGNSHQPRKNLRQTLWQLQTALTAAGNGDGGFIRQIGSDWVGVDPSVNVWLDVEILESAFKSIENVPGRALEAEATVRVDNALALYRGELLEGFLGDWCLFERERLRETYLALLDKMMAYSLALGRYQTGIGYGDRALRLDRARERTHRSLMRLHYSRGDRTQALRQYQHCVAALRQELDVEPARRTLELYEQICRDRLSPWTDRDSTTDGNTAGDSERVRNRDGLRELRRSLDDTRHQIEREIQAIDRALRSGN
jgi:DNA-binding SARP family transcriptional activator